MTPPLRYPFPARLLHWLMALLIMAGLALGYYLTSLPDAADKLALIATLQRRYPADLARRYALANVEGEDFQVLEAIGRKRGAVRSGGHVDLQKAAEILLTDFRSATIGRITLETPEEWLDIAAEIERRRAIEREQQALRDAERKARRAGGRRPNPQQDEDDDA